MNTTNDVFISFKQLLYIDFFACVILKKANKITSFVIANELQIVKECHKYI